MPTVADCLRQHAPAYLAKFGERVPLGHRKVLGAITRCRTGELGSVRYQCDDCGREHWVGRSCGNRHCPNCGKDKSSAWLEKQAERLLPVHHFLVTFTVPDQVGWVLRGSQRDGYAALFDAGAESIVDVGSATKSLRGCQLGFFGVLHTWGRDPMVYHPHVHFVVPGGGVSEDGSAWQATPENFLFHHATLIRVYKAKLAAHLRARGLYDAVPAAAWQSKFVVDIKPVGDGQAVLKYLAPYVNRVAISDNRIVACDDSSVTFRYTPTRTREPNALASGSEMGEANALASGVSAEEPAASADGSRRTRCRQVSGQEFVRGFAQHTLPSRFQKIRYYGWMSPNSKVHVDEVKWLVWLFLGWTFYLASGRAVQKTTPRPTVRCTECGGTMRIVEITFEPRRVLPQHALAYLDSG